MERPRTEEEQKELMKKIRSRNKDGRWRKKRSDTGKKRKQYRRGRSLYYWRCDICEDVTGTFWNRAPSCCYYIPKTYLGFGKREDFIKGEVNEE